MATMMSSNVWMTFLLMASFVTFFVGGTHLRFRPLSLVTAWFGIVLAVAWTWTRISERRERERWFSRLDDDHTDLFAPARRADLVRALHVWSNAPRGEYRRFDDLLGRRRLAFLENFGEAVEKVRTAGMDAVPAAYFVRLAEAYRDDGAFCRAFFAPLEGEFRVDLWRRLLEAAEEALEGDTESVRQVVSHWSSLPAQAPAKEDLVVLQALGRWARSAGERFAADGAH